MDESRNLSARIKRARERAREDGALMILVLLLRQGLALIKIYFNPFYYMEEKMHEGFSPLFKTLPAGYEFSFFGPDEMAIITLNPERKSFPDSYVYGNYQAGDTCLGCKFNGEIAGFSWYSLKESREWYYKTLLKENEAYLFDIFVFKAFRGQRLSLLLRVKCYELLQSLGRDTYYSITDYTNKASCQFKKKLNAKKVFLGLHVDFFGKWNKTWILKRYSR